MSRLVLVRPGSGSPDLLSLEAWQALSRPHVFAAAGDPLAERMREAGLAVAVVDAASSEALRSAAAPVSPGGKPALRLLAHVHEVTSPGAAALADVLASLAAEHGEAVFLMPAEHADQITRSVMERALQGGVDIEVVIGRAPVGHMLLDAVAVMERLRGPGGCPWDAEQTHETLAKYLLDESYELLEAIESGNLEHLEEELGDLLLQVLFHSEIATSFAIDDVAATLVTKLVGRHPHVFGDVEVAGASEVVANWDVIKQHEKQRSSVLEGVPEALPALAYAQKLLRRSEQAGFAKSQPDPRSEEDFGEALFALTVAARAAGVDAESALRKAARAFRDRVVRAEKIATERGVALADLPEDERKRIWEDA